MGSDITRLEASIVWFREAVGEGRAKGVSGHGDLGREEGAGGKKREGQEGQRGQWNGKRMEVQRQTEIRMRGTWNGGGGEGSLELAGTGTGRHSLGVGEIGDAEEWNKNARRREKMSLHFLQGKEIAEISELFLSDV